MLGMWYKIELHSFKVNGIWAENNPILRLSKCFSCNIRHGKSEKGSTNSIFSTKKYITANHVHFLYFKFDHQKSHKGHMANLEKCDACIYHSEIEQWLWSLLGEEHIQTKNRPWYNYIHLKATNVPKKYSSMFFKPDYSWSLGPVPLHQPNTISKCDPFSKLGP